MQKTRNMILAVILILIGLLCYRFFYLSEDTNITQEGQVYIETTLSRADEAAYSAKVNSWLEKKQQEKELYLKSINTPKGKAKLDKNWSRVSSFASAQLAEIKFYAKVVDQYDQPVPNVEITFNAESGYLARGGGHNQLHSDGHGLFSIEDVKGVGLSVYEMSKSGYEFKLGDVKSFTHYKRFPDSRLWTEYSTPEKPFVFRAWKVEGQAKVKSDIKDYHFTPDGRDYSVDLTSTKRTKFNGKGKGSFDVSFTRTAEEWQLVLSAPSGGFIESSVVYMNLAPELGYKEKIVLKGKFDKKKNIIKKQYFLKSQSGEYARLLMEIRPYFQEDSFIELDYAVNMSGTRGLVNTIKEPPRFPD